MSNFDLHFADDLVDYTKKVKAVGSTNNEGVYVEGAEVVSSFKATRLQPLNMNELNLLPDGEKAFSYVRVYTSEALSLSDVVTSNSKDYKVMKSEDRNEHYKVYLRLI